MIALWPTRARHIQRPRDLAASVPTWSIQLVTCSSSRSTRCTWVVADQFTRIRLVFKPGPQFGCLDVPSMARLLRPRSIRVVRAAPVVLLAEGVAQRIEASRATRC